MGVVAMSKMLVRLTFLVKPMTYGGRSDEQNARSYDLFGKADEL